MAVERHASDPGSDSFRDLVRSEARWLAVLDTARDAIISIDRAGIVTLFNRSAEEIFGYPAAEVVGRNVSMLMPSPYREEHDRYIRSYQDTGVPRAIGRIREVEGRRKNGEVFPIELSVSEARLGDEVLYVAIIRDVTDRRATEDALRRERDFAERLIETAQGIVVVLDPRGRIVRFNPYFESLSGHPLAEVRGLDAVSTLMPDRDRRRAHEAFGRVAHGHELHGFVCAIVTRDGAERDIEWHAKALHDPGGGVEALLAIGVDLTERIRNERRFAAQYAVTRALAEAPSVAQGVPDILQAICDGCVWDVGEIWRVDAESGVLRWDGMWGDPALRVAELEAASRDLTFSPGAGFPGSVWASGQIAHVDDLAAHPEFRRALLAAKAGLRSASAFPIRSGGRVVGVMVFFSRETYRPDPELFRMLDSLGNQIGDFFERKRVDEAVRSSEARFFAFMNNSPAVAFIKDAEGRYLYVNQPFEREFAHTLAEIRGKTDYDLWPAETARELRANDRAVIAADRTVEMLETVPLPTGERRQWLVFKFPITDPAIGHVLAGMGVDITERLRAEEELRRMQKVAQERERLADIGAITAKIAHDLGNPLGALSMQTQVMLRRAERDPDASVASLMEPARQIGSEVRRLEALLRELMSFAREQRLDLSEIDGPALLSEVRALWEPFASDRDVTLEVVASDDAKSFEADEGKLRRVLDNLVKNALEAIGTGPGRVTLAVSAVSPETVRIRVDDTGSGVPASVKVFGLFETTKTSGSGLGLAVARQLIQAHGGDLSYAPVEPHGASFRIDLPRRGAAPSAKAPV